jgi:hypothetical protein
MNDSHNADSGAGMAGARRTDSGDLDLVLQHAPRPLVKGDVVVYSLEHYHYLNTIGRWPSHVGRRNHLGMVAGASGQVASVSWLRGGITVTTKHFSDHLELYSKRCEDLFALPAGKERLD